MKLQGFRIMMLVLMGALFLSVSSTYAVTIVLKSGKTVEGKLIEKTDKYIKIDFQGLPLTYFLDEIENIDGVRQVPFLAEEKKSSQENNLPSVHAETAKEAFDSGKALLLDKKIDEAIVDFNKAIKIDPNYAEAYMGRGGAYFFKKDFNQAIGDYSKAIEIDPSASNYFNRGSVYDFKDDLDQAIIDYTKAIEIDPSDEEAYINRCFAYFRKNNYDKAWDDVHK